MSSRTFGSTTHSHAFYYSFALLSLSAASAAPTTRGSCPNGPNLQGVPALMTTVSGVKVQGGTPLSPLLFAVESIKNKPQTYTVKNFFGEGLTLSGDGKSVSFANIANGSPSSSQSWTIDCAECGDSKPIASNCKVRMEFKGKPMCLATNQNNPGNGKDNLAVAECSSSTPSQFFNFTKQ